MKTVYLLTFTGGPLTMILGAYMSKSSAEVARDEDMETPGDDGLYRAGAPITCYSITETELHD